MKINGLKYLFSFICSLVVVTATAQLEFNFSDTTVSECKGILYDNGGDGVNYLHNTNQTFSICLNAPGILTFSFDFFCLEVGFDSLTFHAGPDEFSPQIGPAFNGITIPPPITISSGCLSVHFVTDANVACTGWEASWTTEVIPPVPPQIDAVLPAPACSSSTAIVNLSRFIKCDSIYAGAFSFNGTLDQQIISATPIGCINDSANQVQLTFSPGLNEGGLYELALTTNFYDACDSLWTFITVDSFQINDCPIVVTLTAENDSICEGGSTLIIAEVTGGNGIYSYTWSDGLPATAGPQTVSPLANTTYILTVDDTSPAVPASGSVTINVFTPALVPASSTQCQNVVPFDLVANPSGGAWFGSGITDEEAGTFNGDSANAGANLIGYYLPISPTFGCTSAVVITILPIDAGLPQAACPGSAPFQLIGQSPVGGTWSGSSVTPNGILTPDTVGEYAVTYTFNGCSDNMIVYVDNISNAPLFMDSLCQSDSSLRYILSPPGGRYRGPGIVDSLNGIFDPGEAYGGLHTISYVLNGCEQQFEVFVKEIYAGWNTSACPAEAPYLLENYYPPGGTWSGVGILDTLTGFFDPGTNQGTNFDAELIYTLSNGCTDTTKVYVRVTDIGRDTILFCSSDNPLTLWRETMNSRPGGGEWFGNGVQPFNNDSAFFIPSQADAGVNYVYYENNTCRDSVVMIVLKNLFSTQPAICEETPDFSISIPSYAYGGEFSGNGIVDDSLGIFSPNQAGGGIHQIFYESISGCTDSVEIEVIPFIQAEIDVPGGQLCYIDSLIAIDLQPAGGLLSGSGIVDSLHFNAFVANQGEHLLSYTVGEGLCQSVDTATIRVAPSIGYSLTVSKDSICYGDFAAINVNAFGGNGNLITYTWNNGLLPQQQQIVSPLQSTEYNLLITDGCSIIKDTIPITVASPINVQFSSSETLCYGEEGFIVANITSQSEYTIKWRGSMYNAGEILPGLASNTYTASITDTISGCKLDTTVTIPGFPLVKSQFTVNPDNDCIPSNIRDINFIDLSTGATQGSWSFGDGSELAYESGVNPFHEYITHGEYSVVLSVADSNGCEDKSEISICLLEPFRVYLPNAMTINQDGLNEIFLAKGEGIQEFKMWIYDKHGNVLFEANKLTDGWDGKFKGRYVPQDVYGWVIEVQWVNNQWFTKAGTLTVFR
jgi:gliding motility-associated-like protein